MRVDIHARIYSDIMSLYFHADTDKASSLVLQPDCIVCILRSDRKLIDLLFEIQFKFRSEETIPPK